MSVGGDGALHVLDDADATGYVKPHPTAYANRKVARKSFSRTWRRGAIGGEIEDSHNDHRRAGHSDDGNDKEGEQDGYGWRGERRRSTKETGKSRPEIRGYDYGATSAALSEEGRPEAEPSVGVEGSTLPGPEAEGGKRGDGGRSVLLRQVALSAYDGDNSAGAGNTEGENTAGRPYNALNRRDSELPEQPPRGAVHGNNLDPDPDSLNGGRLLTVEPPEDSSGSVSGSGSGSTASVGKSRYGWSRYCHRTTCCFI